MSQRKINVLLLGETGVGKTTLINMLPNYLLDQTLADVASKDLAILAPTNFIHINDKFEERTIQLGSDSNEVTQPGASSTQRPRSYLYVLPSKNTILQVIDSPGIGDTRGPERDKQNTQALLRYISELQYLDAVCILLKPDNSRFSVLFEHCLRIILKELVVNVRNNLAFVFTRSRGSHYKPGETYGPLKRAIEDIQRETNSVIPFGKNNTFCIDNEAFRYLVARKNGVTFHDDEIKRFTESYTHSSKVVKTMIDYVATLAPVPMQNVATPNESKRLILRLSKPLMSLLTNYEKAVVQIREYEAVLEANMSNLDLLKQNLFKVEYEKIVREKSTEEHHKHHSVGVTIGASYPVFSVSGNVNYNYTDKDDTVTTRDIDFVQKRSFDKDVYAMITDENSARAAVRAKITEMNNLCDEYKKEMVTVLAVAATFYVYCRDNDLTTNDDPFVKALQSAKEEATLDNNKVLANEFDIMIKRYEIKKSGIADVYPEDIQEMVQELYNLKHSGVIFKQIMKAEFTFHTISSIRP